MADSNNGKHTCKFCALVVKAHEAPMTDGFVTIGATLGEFRTQECATCQTLVDAIDTRADGMPLDDSEGLILARGDTGFAIGLMSGAMFGAHVVGRPSDSGEYPVLTVDDQWIDIDRVRRWIQTCDGEHSGSCHSVADPWLRLDGAFTILLIDVEEECLVWQDNSCKYVALSYCWGPDPDQLCTTLHTLKSFVEPGAFSRSSVRPKLPQTILDSMALTNKLGLKYLWVDRFCIVQDDHDAIDERLGQMASIYANSYITIAACEGTHSNVGLLGIGKHPRSKPYFELAFTPVFIATSDQPRRAIVPNQDYEKYHHRAWCFQEWMLAPRILAFHHNTMSWKCHKTFVQENGYQFSYTVMPESSLSSRSILSRWPNLLTYTEMVTEFSTRQLTYQRDALDAFGAIISSMGRAMRGGILYGLPEMFFAGALLWRKDVSCGRRKDQTGRVIRELPSWSWIGWEGAVDLRWWLHAHPYLDLMQAPNLDTVVLHPCIRFSKTEVSTWNTTPVDNSYYNHSDLLGGDVEFALPGAYPVRLPIPLASSTTFSPLSYSPILTFRTTCVKLAISTHTTNEDLYSHPSEHHSRHFLVHGSPARVVGLVETHVPETSTFRVDESPCSMIAISRMELRGDVAPEARYAHTKCNVPCRDWKTCNMGEVWKYECVNVMWVEWDDDGLAYRRSVGRVFASFWDGDEAEREEVDVRLG